MLPEIGIEGQRRLAGASALVVGLGGLGSPVAMYLAASGIGRLGLVDADTVSVSNLQRQILYADGQVGLSKTDCAKERIVGLAGGHCLVDQYRQWLTAYNARLMIEPYDVVVDCTDNFATRLIIDEACAALGKPWVHGSLDGFTGCVTVFNHIGGRRYRDLYPDADELAAAPKRMIGTVGPVAGVVGSLQAAEAIKLLIGTGDPLDGRLLAVDLLTMNFNILEF